MVSEGDRHHLQRRPVGRAAPRARSGDDLRAQRLRRPAGGPRGLAPPRQAQAGRRRAACRGSGLQQRDARERPRHRRHGERRARVGDPRGFLRVDRGADRARGARGHADGADHVATARARSTAGGRAAPPSRRPLRSPSRRPLRSPSRRPLRSPSPLPPHPAPWHRPRRADCRAGSGASSGSRRSRSYSRRRCCSCTTRSAEGPVTRRAPPARSEARRRAFRGPPGRQPPATRAPPRTRPARGRFPRRGCDRSSPPTPAG